MSIHGWSGLRTRGAPDGVAKCPLDNSLTLAQLMRLRAVRRRSCNCHCGSGALASCAREAIPMDGPFGVFPAPVLYPTIGFFSNPRISPIVSLIDWCFFNHRLLWATAIDASPSFNRLGGPSGKKRTVRWGNPNDPRQGQVVPHHSIFGWL